MDLNALHKQWYDWTMKGGPKPEFLQDRIAYFVPGAGAEVWRYVQNLETLAAQEQKLYLRSVAGVAQDVFHSGQLADKSATGAEAPDRFVYDPLDTRPADLANRDTPPYLLDQTSALNLFGNGLVYHSEPLPEATETAGYAKLTIWVAMDVPDTDLSADLSEIRPDGTSVELGSDLVRARYRDSLTEAKLVKPDEVNRFQFEFPFFARLLEKEGAGCGSLLPARIVFRLRRITTAEVTSRRNRQKTREPRTSVCITTPSIRVCWRYRCDRGRLEFLNC